MSDHITKTSVFKTDNIQNLKTHRRFLPRSTRVKNLYASPISIDTN